MAAETEDLYESAAPPAPKAESEEDKTSKEDEGGKTFLVPSEICPGMKPGEEMVVTIKAVHDEQYEISYAPKKEESEEEGSPEMAQAPNPGAGGGGGEDSMYS